jgi:hypothetical protein
MISPNTTRGMYRAWVKAISEGVALFGILLSLANEKQNSRTLKYLHVIVVDSSPFYRLPEGLRSCKHSHVLSRLVTIIIGV